MGLFSVLVVQDGADPSEAAPAQGARENLWCALKSAGESANGRGQSGGHDLVCRRKTDSTSWMSQGDSSRRTPEGGEDRRAGKVVRPNPTCKAICNGVEGAEWENSYHMPVDMNEKVAVRNPGGSSRAKTLWKMRGHQKRDDAHCDQKKNGF